MLNNIFSKIRDNYEKIILSTLSVFLIIVGARLAFGSNKAEQLKEFKNRIQPAQQTNIELEPIYDKNLQAYLVKNPFSYYKPLSDRAVFFPLKGRKEEKPLPPEMNFKCTEIVSSGAGFLTAILEDTETGRTYSVRSGERVGQFTVRNITREGVVLMGEQGKSYTLEPPAVVMPYRLTGVMPTDSGYEAMLQNTRIRKTYFVKEGDKVNDWEVLSISSNTVIIFRKDAGKYELKIGGQSKRVEN